MMIFVVLLVTVSSVDNIVSNPQCKWINCDEGCPAGCVLMKRQDKDARGIEYMFDETGCGGMGSHAFCCPLGNLRTCGWYTQNNGRCDSTCPDGTVEIGSNNMYCRWNYQAACCTKEQKSMKLYTTCEWGEKPVCDAQKGCPNNPFRELMAWSSSGTGGGSCNMRSGGFPASEWVVQGQKFCCDTSDEKRTFYTATGMIVSGPGQRARPRTGVGAAVPATESA